MSVPSLAWLGCFNLILLACPLRAEGLLGKYLKMKAAQAKQAQPAASPTQVTPSKVPITGGFGYRFGDVVGPGRPARESEDTVFYQFKPTEPLPGFSIYLLGLTPLSHRVAVVLAEAYGDDPELGKRMLATLTARHGQDPATKVEGDAKSYVWTDGKKDVELKVGASYVWLIYNDHTHENAAAAEMKKREAHPPVEALKGPLHLRALTGSHAFGVDLGAVLQVPAKATRTPTEVTFAFRPKDAIPGFSSHWISLDPTQFRAYEVTATSTSLTASEVQQLIVDLESRFGPSTLEIGKDGTGYRQWMFPGQRSLSLEREKGSTTLRLIDGLIQYEISTGSDAATK